eukprot:CAMPEP_0202696026 /NCGR_PEP_ID=MMETSP1385-20130828/9415_1 /ASSEMBLY_ACC=CAM_ASM_000861 /TAXON_ID=933848 /ORGANISM="Elphidium margaritaceum" /LENGTH=160 /DNA_ID=CAMNT_0049352121 /DNA_START=60 /DNA_END=542 /DNA_ORIENTATION=-
MAMSKDAAVQILSLCNLVLVFKYFMTVILQGGRRTRAPEDGFQPSALKKEANEALLSGADAEQKTESEKFEFSVEKRWQRIVMNDLENVLIGIVMIWISFFVSDDYLVTAICAILFTLARVLHTVCYIFALFPWRAFCWMFGVLSTLTLAINIVYGAFKS